MCKFSSKCDYRSVTIDVSSFKAIWFHSLEEMTKWLPRNSNLTYLVVVVSEFCAYIEKIFLYVSHFTFWTGHIHIFWRWEKFYFLFLHKNFSIIWSHSLFVWLQTYIAFKEENIFFNFFLTVLVIFALQLKMSIFNMWCLMRFAKKKILKYVILFLDFICGVFGLGFLTITAEFYKYQSDLG